MASVCNIKPTIELLLSNNNFVSAMDLIVTVKEILANELNGIHILKYSDIKFAFSSHILVIK
jgi:hypothetical protein